MKEKTVMWIDSKQYYQILRKFWLNIFVQTGTRIKKTTTYRVILLEGREQMRRGIG